jgi:UDP:flavonoid glycosyltransferase YjiC (YdhE family)
MRVLFCVQRDLSHLFPLVPLAWACRAAGHEVRIAGPPALQDVIVHTGLPAVTVGRDQPMPNNTADIKLAFQHKPFPVNWPAHPHLLDEPQHAVIEMLARNACESAEYTVDGLIAFARDWRADVVVHDILGFVGAVAAAAAGIPNVRLFTGIALQPMEGRIGGTEPFPEYTALFERRGLPVRMLPSLSIIPAPPTLQPPVPGPCRAMRYVPYNGPGVVPSWVTEPAGRPRVLLTWGMAVNRAISRVGPQALAPFRLAVEAVHTLDVEVVVTGTAEQLSLLGGLADNVRSVVGAPLHLLLPSCAAIVHQGGDGSSMAAAVYGVPQVTVGRTQAEVLVGERLAAAGAAVNLRYNDLESDPNGGGALAAAVAKVLADPTYSESAARIQQEFDRLPAPTDLVPVLRELASVTA